MSQTKKNVLVTGANGQLGNALRELSAKYPQFCFLFTDVEELDITDEAAVSKMVNDSKVDLIINCAAYTAVDKAENNKELAHRLNALAPEILARAIEERGGEMIHVSTDYVFDGRASEPYTEDIEPNPQSVYGHTKLEGEECVQKACQRSIILRTAWLYSLWGNNFVKTMMRLGREREQLNVVFDQIGSPTYALDLAHAILDIAASERKTYGVFHFSNEGVISWYDFTKAIHRLANIEGCKVMPIRSAQYPTPAQRPAYSVLDKGKVKQAYAIEIPYWEDSLRLCIRQLLDENI